MISIPWLLNKRINIRLALFLGLSLMLIVAPTALASYDPGEQKPVPPERRSDGGTVRGCSGDSTSLTVLASRNDIKTISRHPTFAWFVPPDSAQKLMKFRIYERLPENKFKEIYNKSLESSTGIMKLSPFSENESGLELGKEYRWQVVIHCDLDNPSGDLVSEASIEVIPIPETVQQALNSTVSSIEKVKIYAQAGLWYNALDEALKLAELSKLGDMGSTLLNDLAQWETSKNTLELPPDKREATEKWINNLKQIANSTR